MERIYLVTATLVFVLAACAKSGDYSDADGLISFDMAEGWRLHSESSGMRFLPAEGADRSTLLVKPDPRDEDIESRRQIGLSQIESQGATLRADETYDLNGFEVWEAQFQLQNILVSSWWLFSDDVRVEVKLMAQADRHAAHLADAEAVLESIRAR